MVPTRIYMHKYTSVCYFCICIYVCTTIVNVWCTCVYYFWVCTDVRMYVCVCIIVCVCMCIVIHTVETSPLVALRLLHQNSHLTHVPNRKCTIYPEILAVIKFGNFPKIWPIYWWNLNLAVCYITSLHRYHCTQC